VSRPDDPARDPARDPERDLVHGAGAPSERISRLEWLVAALGLLFVLGTTGFLVADALVAEPTPPRIVVRADSVAALGPSGWLVRFTARNEGRETVAGLSIVGELRLGADTIEARATLDYLPGRSERGGGLLYPVDPRRGALQLRAEGFREP